MGNIFKYTFLTIVIFCGTKILHFVKQSNENYSNQLPTEDSNTFNNLEKKFNIYTTIKEDENEINETGEKISTVTTDTLKWTKSKNSTNLINRLQRKRKLLSQMWDKYYKIGAGTTFRIKDTSAFHQVGDDIFAFSAFYDNREILGNQNPVLRIVTISKLQSRASLECRFSKTRASQWVQATRQVLSDNHGKPFGGVMYTCNVPHTIGNKPPKTVYLQSLLTHEDHFSKVTSALVTVEIIPLGMSLWKSTIYHNVDNLKKFTSENWHTSDAKHFLETSPNDTDLKEIRKIDKSQTHQGKQLDFKIVQNREELRRTRNSKLPSISVCVPPLFGNIKLSEFIQFVEIHKILGASQIFFYKMRVSSDIGRMLDYYQSQGIVTPIDWHLPSGLQDSMNIWYHGQSAAQQDCLYRSIGNFDFTAFIDLDEVIVPYTDSDWLSMLERLEQAYTKGKPRNIAAFMFKSAFFESDIKINDGIKTSQHKLSLLKNIYRNAIVSSVRTKVIVKPAYIEHIGVHHVSKLVNSSTKLDIIHVPVKTALIHHNRKCTTALDTEMHCGKYVSNASLLKYADILVKNYEEALEYNVKYFRSIR
ncbi:uncharacterized protein LOC123554474 [Mercenaria mercenaria]|uniref:uncharacterized protein LOC123554474 n=1 Tax=Mercenaria mercenaria TaxID=6596 RepID=UPI00234E5FB6|nr:uncharacterized protein LOC123554474 [Mercenaria mercenaria]